MTGGRWREPRACAAVGETAPAPRCRGAPRFAVLFEGCPTPVKIACLGTKREVGGPRPPPPAAAAAGAFLLFLAGGSAAAAAAFLLFFAIVPRAGGTC